VAAVGALRAVLREWSPRLALAMLLSWAVAAAFPVLSPADERLFTAINGLGDGPEWLYQALDPHSRNYTLLALAAAGAVLVTGRRLRFVAGAVLTVLAAGVLADLVMELLQLGIDRPRPEEALGADAQLSHDRHWAHIPSFPSGHLMVTSALVAAGAALAPRLRNPLLLYLAAVAVTRITFGAHFPLDVVVGTIAGWQVGLFSVALTQAARLVPAPRSDGRSPALGSAAEPVPAHATATTR